MNGRFRRRWRASLSGALEHAGALMRVGATTGLVRRTSASGVHALLTHGRPPTPSTIFRYHAANTPHEIALEDEEQSLDFGALDTRIDAVARALIAHGVQAGDRVVLMMPNCVDFVVVQAACVRMGAAAVSAAAGASPREIAYLLGHADPKVVFVHPSLTAIVDEAVHGNGKRGLLTVVELGSTSTRGNVSLDEFLAPGLSNARVIDVAGDGAVVVYTSGTTGKPKGAVRRFGLSSVLPLVHVMDRLPFEAGQTHLTVCPLYHSTAFAFTNLALLLGAKVRIVSRFDPRAFVDALQEHGVHHTAVVPTMLERVLELDEGWLRRRRFDSLRAIVCGGAPLSASLERRARKVFGPVIYNFYGSTETGVVTVADPSDLSSAPGTVGRAVPGNELRLYDDHGHRCAVGDVGELYVRSGNLIDGYHDDQAATDASKRDGFFSVGDLARVDSRGFWFIEGRKRDMVISGGVNVYPLEVEDVLRELEGVRDVAVVGVDDERWGECLCAFVVTREEAGLDEEGIVAFCRTQLHPAKRPRRICLLDELPRNPTGKVLKRELRARLARC